MKNLFLYAILAMTVCGFLSCENFDNMDSDGVTTLENNLKAAVTEVVSTSVDGISTQDIQSTSVESYNGLGEAIRFNRLKNGGDMMHFRIPRISQCATITVSDSLFPKEIIIDYGTDCSDNRHHTISGKIIINLSDSLTQPGAVKTVLFQDFYMDSVQVEYNATIKNLGLNANGNLIMQSSSEQVLTLADGTVLTQKNEETITWLKGFETTSKDDDKFYKTGSGSLSINGTLKYSRTITTPLLYDRGCGNIVSGTVELIKSGSNVSIDYGDGTCDNVANVTTDGVTEEININSHEFGDKGMFGKHCNGFGHKGHNNSSGH